jgi:hypothetical protein
MNRGLHRHYLDQALSDEFISEIPCITLAPRAPRVSGSCQRSSRSDIPGILKQRQPILPAPSQVFSEPCRRRISRCLAGRNCSRLLSSRDMPGVCQAAESLLVSSSTTWVEILPLGASVAIRATAAFRSRKLPTHIATGERAKLRNFSRTSLLKLTCRPALSARRSNSKSRSGRISRNEPTLWSASIPG